MSSSDTVIANQLQTVVDRLLPGRSQPRVVDLTRITDGWECDVFSFVLESHGDALPAREALILRVYQGQGAARKAVAEFDVMRRLRAVGYPAPEVHALVVDDSPLDGPFVIMEKIEGPTLGTSMELASGDAQAALLRRFCKLVVDLHALDWREIVPNASPAKTAVPIDDWIAEAEARLAQFPFRDFDPAIAWLRDRSADVSRARRSAIHQDFHPWNVLLDPSGHAFVIDWTQIDVSDYRFDLAWTLLLIRAVFGRSTRDLMLSEYERLAGASVVDLGFFEAVAAVKRVASIYISVTVGAEALGMRPGAEARMLDELNHLLTARAVLLERTGLTIPGVEALVASRTG